MWQCESLFSIKEDENKTKLFQKYWIPTYIVQLWLNNFWYIFMKTFSYIMYVNLAFLAHTFQITLQYVIKNVNPQFGVITFLLKRSRTFSCFSIWFSLSFDFLLYLILTVYSDITNSNTIYNILYLWIIKKFINQPM